MSANSFLVNVLFSTLSTSGIEVAITIFAARVLIMETALSAFAYGVLETSSDLGPLIRDDLVP